MKPQIKRGLVGASCAVLCLVLMPLASCGEISGMPGSESAHIQEAEAYAADETVIASADEESRILRSMVYDAAMPPDAVPDDVNITLEFVQYTPDMISLILTNNSGFEIQCGDAYMITGKTFGGMGADGIESFNLLSGEEHEITIKPPGWTGFSLGFGEFRISTDITVAPENTSAERKYRLYADFAIENTEIPADMSGVSIEADFATPIGAWLNITNGFESGRVYFDKSYRLMRNTGGEWQAITAIGSDVFPDDIMQSLAPRQVLSHYTVYWDWLYGEMSPGQYRLEKAFWLRADDGTISKHIVYADFSLDGEPIPDVLHREGSTWGHPFSGISTFRAEVLQPIDRYNNINILWGPGMLVESLTPLWDSERTGELFYVWDSSVVTVLDPDGNQIKFTDIKQGATVAITFSGIILTSNPAHMGGALVIRVSE